MATADKTATGSDQMTLPRDVVRPQDIAIIPPGIRDSSRRRIYTPVAKDWAIFEKYGRETKGEYTLLTVGLAPGGENAAHWHGSYSETFTAGKSEVGIYSKTKGKMMLAPGETITVPPGEVHCFYNPGEEEVEFEIKLHPAREGFEKGLYILYGLARDGKASIGGVPHNPMHLAIACSMSDMWLPGMVGWISSPIIKALAALGRLLGIEKRLVQRYWE